METALSSNYMDELNKLADEEEDIRKRLHELKKVPGAQDLRARLKDKLDSIVETAWNLKALILPMRTVDEKTRKPRQKTRKMLKAGRPKEGNVTLIVQTLHSAGIKEPIELRDSAKLRNVFAQLERENKAEIPGVGGKDWLALFDNPEKSEELKSVRESLRKQLTRRRTK